ncbi:MAG: translation elongation factor Ts [Bacteroidota bacterium]
MAITASMVNELRQKTNAGMMDCKNALVEADGDFEKAIDILRKKGQKIAAKREDRDATEGVVIAKTTADNKRGALIVLNCETDFVAKNENFVTVANKMLDIAIDNNPADLEALKALPYGDGLTIGEKVIEQTGVIGEKIDLSEYAPITAEEVIVYNHPGNRLASIIGLSKSGEKIAEAGREIAMQVAAMAPVALTREEIPQATIDRELEVGKDLAIQEGKPADMAEKIAQGRLNKFFKEAALLEQEYINDNKVSVTQYLTGIEKDLTITSFKRISLS